MPLQNRARGVRDFPWIAAPRAVPLKRRTRTHTELAKSVINVTGGPRMPLFLIERNYAEELEADAERVGRILEVNA